MSDKPVFHYWAGVASRGHYLFYTLAFHGKLDDIEVKGDQPYPGTPEWAADEIVKSKTGQLPFLVDGDVSIGQSGAIFAYVMKKLGIGADLSLADFAKSQELAHEAVDMHAALSRAHYSADRTAAMDALFAEGGGWGKTLAAFEDHIGGAVTPGHCCFAATLNIGTRLQPDCLDKFPNVKALNEMVQANEGIKAAEKRSPYSYFKRNSDA